MQVNNTERWHISVLYEAARIACAHDAILTQLTYIRSCFHNYFFIQIYPSEYTKVVLLGTNGGVS